MYTKWKRVVEQALIWIHQFRRLHIRYEKRLVIYMAFLKTCRCIICFKKNDERFLFDALSKILTLPPMLFKVL